LFPTLQPKDDDGPAPAADGDEDDEDDEPGSPVGSPPPAAGADDGYPGQRAPLAHSTGLAPRLQRDVLTVLLAGAVAVLDDRLARAPGAAGAALVLPPVLFLLRRAVVVRDWAVREHTTSPGTGPGPGPGPGAGTGSGVEEEGLGVSWGGGLDAGLDVVAAGRGGTYDVPSFLAAQCVDGPEPFSTPPEAHDGAGPPAHGRERGPLSLLLRLLARCVAQSSAAGRNPSDDDGSEPVYAGTAAGPAAPLAERRTLLRALRRAGADALLAKIFADGLDDGDDPPAPGAPGAHAGAGAGAGTGAPRPSVGVAVDDRVLALWTLREAATLAATAWPLPPPGPDDSSTEGDERRLLGWLLWLLSSPPPPPPAAVAAAATPAAGAAFPALAEATRTKLDAALAGHVWGADGPGAGPGRAGGEGAAPRCAPLPAGRPRLAAWQRLLLTQELRLLLAGTDAPHIVVSPGAEPYPAAPTTLFLTGARDVYLPLVSPLAPPPLPPVPAAAAAAAAAASPLPSVGTGVSRQRSHDTADHDHPHSATRASPFAPALRQLAVGRCPASAGRVRLVLTALGGAEVLANCVVGHLASPAVRGALLRYSDDVDSGVVAAPRAAGLTDVEVEAWWSSLVALGALVTDCVAAKQALDASIGLTTLVRALLPVALAPHVAAAGGPAWETVTARPAAVAAFLLELCVGAGPTATGARVTSPGRAFLAASTLSDLLPSTPGPRPDGEDTAAPDATTAAVLPQLLLRRALQVRPIYTLTRPLSSPYPAPI